MIEQTTKPWWTYGYLWLVISGPLTVVVAACVSGWIALRGADPVLDHDYYRSGIEINRKIHKNAAMEPAVFGRNNAQTGGTQTATPEIPQRSASR